MSPGSVIGQLLATCALVVAFSHHSLLGAQAHAGPGLAEPAGAPSVALSVTDGLDVRFARLSTRDGLSQTRVLQILQDDRGFMWFGTQYGLNRYDGYTFKLFKHVPERADSLSSVYVYSLFKDREGTLWVGGEETLDRFDSRTETFTHYPLLPQASGDLPAPVVHISQDRAGMLWLSTRQGLNRFDPATGQIVRHRHNPDDRFGLSSDNVKSTGEDSTGTLWVAAGDSLEAFDAASGRVTRRVPLGEPVRELSFHEDRTGVFWIIYNPSGGDGGLAVFDRAANTLTRYRFDDHDRSAALTGVYDVIESHDGTLWFATMGAGLVKFERERSRFVRYRHDPGDPESLAENRVIALYEDREGHIWAGLHARPPNYFATRRPPFLRIAHQGHDPHSLGESMVNGIYVDSQDVVWLGTGGSLSRFDRHTNQYRFHRSPGPGVSNDVLSIAEDRSGGLWVGTLSGLHRFDRNAGWLKSYRHVPGDRSSLSNDIVTRLLVDRSGTLWAATLGGLSRYDETRDAFVVYGSGSYTALAEDPAGNLWIASNVSGLLRLNLASGAFTSYRRVRGAASLSDNRVNAVFVDRVGTTWVGTQNGLNRYNPADSSFTTYDEGDGLAGNAVSCILEDDRGNLWLSTNRGLSRFNPVAARFDNFSAADGLPGNDLTGWGACHRSGSGEMFFGGFSGATYFQPDSLPDHPYVPTTVLTGLRLSGQEAAIGTDEPLTTAISYADGITLPHWQNVFSLEFAALGFSHPETNRYRYRLDGLDERWIEVGANRRVATYTTLPAGEYTFRVQGATSRSAWNEPGTALRIEILPPWWRTPWFMAACTALVGLSVWTAYRYRVRQIAHHYNARIEERISERTRIARELHDTLLQGFISASLQLHVATERLPGSSQTKAHLARVLQLMEQVIEEGRQAVRGLRSPGIGDDLADALSAIQRELATDTTTQYRMMIEGRPRALKPGIRDELYSIGREAVINAFRHADARTVEVALEYANRELRLIVRDDGRGFDAPTVTHGHQGHWGLVGMRERTHRIEGQFTLSSRPGVGTEVRVSVPAAVAFQGDTPRRWLRWITPRRS